MIPPLQSLVKYDNAVQVSTGQDKKKGAKKVCYSSWSMCGLSGSLVGCKGRAHQLTPFERDLAAA